MVRFAQDMDFQFVKNLWITCFDDTPEFTDYIFEHNYCAENTVIALDGDTPSSAMQLKPCRLTAYGEALDTRYVSGVATLPQRRGKGLVRQMFEFGLPALYDMGCDLSILIPAVDGMYEKFGYCAIGGRSCAYFDELPSIKKVCDFDKGIIPKLDGIYKRATENSAIYTPRNYKTWEFILTDLEYLSKGALYINESGGETVGYAIGYPNPQKGMEIIELCGETGVPSGLISSAAPTMGRIINVQSVIEKLGNFLPDKAAFEIYDEHIPQNNGIFYTKNGASVTDAPICMSIDEFTGFVFQRGNIYGFLPPCLMPLM